MKRIISIFMCIVMSVCMIMSLGITAQAASSGTTVYITKTGECYHNSGCQYLRKSCIPISLGDAVNDGYRACSKCGPPSLTYDKPAAQTKSSGGAASTIIPKATPKPTPTPTPKSLEELNKEYGLDVKPYDEDIYKKLGNTVSTPTPTKKTVEANASNDNGDGATAGYVVLIIAVGAGAYFVGRGRKKG